MPRIYDGQDAEADHSARQIRQTVYLSCQKLGRDCWVLVLDQSQTLQLF